MTKAVSGRHFGWNGFAFLVVLMGFCISAKAEDTDGPVKLEIVGGLDAVTQYTKLEQPFWEKEIEQRSNGRIKATIRPLDSSGLRGQEMLQLMRLGVVPFGTALAAVVAGDEPEFNALDLPILNPDMATLRKTADAFRGRLSTLLRERYDIELLGIYTYPAQVAFCVSDFSGLDDLSGRRVRTSSVGQSELMTALGAVPVQLPFAEVASALRDGVVDCAITGTLSGYEIGLDQYTTHVHAMALSWGLSFFGANVTTWQALPPADREIIRAGVADLEKRIWAQAEQDTERGLACNTGASLCGPAPARPMTLVPTSKADAERRRQLLSEVVLPRWIARCGDACAQDWNSYLAAVHDIKVGAE
ncbi:TRAP transporter substrate-binding protein [Kaistia dalseonensis]|uniref:TRAP-type C4-dicarboxylate transport system substrate-binding protein n=1 Tax=Kaistia dalseonensis TaxID=410840 RepID=A0ABU0H9C6_9HYPH|nr:TRAP transporter substrate-binding protein [Kaistia dalseonensis]MCX5495512.1 TRAP transporter substrate-binding protein [Kaistia dalseonensis]MDQ0438104.1 TRAP-type C4-dicarboxylate transport system substrate-binding protein [Kaistia dalseonensis]